MKHCALTEAVREAVRASGIKQAAIAAAAGLTTGNLSRVMTGRRNLWSLTRVRLYEAISQLNRRAGA